MLFLNCPVANISEYRIYRKALEIVSIRLQALYLDKKSLAGKDTRKVKVLSLPETIKEKSTFRAKALFVGPSLETSIFPLSFQVVREPCIIEYITYTGNVSPKGSSFYDFLVSCWSQQINTRLSSHLLISDKKTPAISYTG